MDNQTVRDRLLTLKEVSSIVGISRSQIYNLIGKKAFPRSISLSSGEVNRCSRWSMNEIDEWIEERKSCRESA